MGPVCLQTMTPCYEPICQNGPVVQLLTCAQLLVTPWTAVQQTSLFFTISQNLLKLMSIKSMMPSNQLIPSFIPFSSCLQFPPASGSFPTSWLFASGGQSIGASASVLPVNVQSWFPLGSTGLISLVAKGLSRAFSSSTVWKHQFFSAQPDPVSAVRAPLSISLWDCQFQRQCHYSSDLGKVT